MPALPDALVQLLGALALALILGLVQLARGWNKGEGTTKPVEAAVVSATVADSRAIRDLVEALDHHRRVTHECCEQRHLDSNAERSAIHELTAAVRQASALPPDLQRLLDKLRDIP